MDSAKKISSNVFYAIGCDCDNDILNEQQLKEAIELAKNVDVAVIFAGLPDSFESEAYDRKHIHMPNCQNKLIQEVCKVQSNTAVVPHNDSPMNIFLKDVKAVIEKLSLWSNSW